MRGYVNYRNIKVRYSDRGAGRVVVLLHGFMESLELFDSLATKLSKTFRVIAIDFPGHGETPVLGYTHTMELMAHCVKTLLDSFYLRKYVLVGHSMGGYVALAYSAKYPETLKGICLLHSTAMPDSNERKEERERMVEIVKQDRSSFISDLIPKLFAKENIPLLAQEVAQAKKVAMATSKEGIVAALRGMKDRPSYESVLKKVIHPVLFIIGKKDVLLAWENLLMLSSLPKKSFSKVLEHAGHMGFYESPEETFKSIRKFSRMCFETK